MSGSLKLYGFDDGGNKNFLLRISTTCGLSASKSFSFNPENIKKFVNWENVRNTSIEFL